MAQGSTRIRARGSVRARRKSGTAPERCAAFSGGGKVESHAKLSAPQLTVKGAGNDQKWM
jgi:hypothetical protein